MSPIAQRRLSQIPTPRLAKKNVLRDRDEPHEHEDRRDGADRDRDEALRNRGRQVDADLAQDDEQHAASSPRTSTILPIVPVCQPRTETVVPSPSPVYQPVRAETASSRPKRKRQPPAEPGRAAGAGERHAAAPSLSGGRLHREKSMGSRRLDRIEEADRGAVHDLQSPRGQGRAHRSRRGCGRRGHRKRGDRPPLDPLAVSQAYRHHRARRRARERWHREKRWAGLRFWLVLVLALAVAVLLAARTLGEIERIFGL